MDTIFFISNLTKWHKAVLGLRGSTGWGSMRICVSDIEDNVEGYGKPGFYVLANFGGVPVGSRSKDDYIWPNITLSDFWKPNITQGSLVLFDQPPHQ